MNRNALSTVLRGGVVFSCVALMLAGCTGWGQSQEGRPAAAARAGGAGPDYSKLKLQGDGHAQDSFSLTIQAAARLLGREADYRTVLALSTNGFAPAILPGAEECPSWWGMYGREGGLDIVCGRVGLRVRKLVLPPLPPRGQDEAETLRRWRDHRQACAPIIRRALEAGEVVITLGGWDWQWRLPDITPHCFWGIITQAAPDGTIRGATLDGRTDNPVQWVEPCWALSAEEPILTPHQADLAMLARAAARIRGQDEPFRPGGIVYGLPAMDVWISRMEKVPFCPQCKGGSWACAFSAARPTYEDAAEVGGYLRACQAGFAEAARPHLAAAAGHYEKIADLLRPAVTGKGGDGYRDIIGDLEKQKAHADVLRQVKAEMASAAGEMEKALSISAAAPVPPATQASTAAVK